MLSIWEVPDPIDILVEDPTITLVTMGAPDTEVSQALPSGTKRFILKSRQSRAVLQMAYVTGEVTSTGGGTYFTIPRRTVYEEDYLDPATGHTLYLSTNIACTVEILSWA